MKPYRAIDLALFAAFWAVVAAVLVGGGMAWGYWIGRSDSRVEIDLWKNHALYERITLREQAKTACGMRTAYINIETDRIHCGLVELWHPLHKEGK